MGHVPAPLKPCPTLGCGGYLRAQAGAGRRYVYCAECSAHRERERCRRYYEKNSERILAKKQRQRDDLRLVRISAEEMGR